MTAPLTADTTTEGIPTSASALSLSWRAYGIALVPLALAGVLPWWACVLIGVAYALGVRRPDWAAGRLLIGLLVVGVLMIGGIQAALSAPKDQLLILWRDLGPLYAQQLISLIVLHKSAALLEEGRPIGFLGVGLVGLVTPHPALLLALAGGALARYAPDDRLRSKVVKTNTRLWLLVGAVLAGLVAFSLVLPRGQVTSQGTSLQVARAGKPTGNQQSQTPPKTAPGQSGGVAKTGQLQVPGSSVLDRLPHFSIELFMLVNLALILAVLWRMRDAHFRLGRRPSLAELLMVAGLIVNFLVILVLGTPLGRTVTGLSAPGDEQGTSRGGAGGLGTVSSHVLMWERYMNLALWLFFLVYLLLGGLLGWYWWKESRDQQGVQRQPELLPNQAEAPLLPLHRVRQAYRHAEALLSDTGRGRLTSETPLGYAGRLAVQDAELSGPLHVLTRAYQPVRYGGRVTEEEADAAESAVRDLQGLLVKLPTRFTEEVKAESDSSGTPDGKEQS